MCFHTYLSLLLYSHSCIISYTFLRVDHGFGLSVASGQKMKNDTSKKTAILILSLIIGILIAYVVYAVSDKYWLKLTMSLSVIVVSLVIIFKNINNKI